MSQDTAHFTAALDTSAKWFRTILGAGVSMESLMLPVDNLEAMANLADFFLKGCPTITMIDGVATTESPIVAKAKWWEEDGVIRFSITTPGRTDQEWIDHFEAQGKKIWPVARQVLGKALVATNGVVREFAVMKGDSFTNRDRKTLNIRKLAGEKKWLTPTVEDACLIRNNFSDKEIGEMGLWWILTMHEPVDADDHSPFLGTGRDDGDSSLLASYGNPDYEWGRGLGFAFVLP
jgi:hypothetical protein